MAKTKIKADSIHELCSIAKAKLLLKSEEDVEVSWTSESKRMNVIIEFELICVQEDKAADIMLKSSCVRTHIVL